MKVLIAEDESTQLLRLQKFLKELEYEVVGCRNGLQAWEAFQATDAPDLLILDWEMPEMSGIELCRKIRDLAREPYTYIILLTSKSTKEDIVAGMEAGADDYITKPFNREELNVRLRAGKRIVELNYSLIESRNEMHIRATHDGLTGLLNRPAIMEALQSEMDRSKREQKPMCVAILDIDHFKLVNDTYGHPAGDDVLKETSKRLKSALRSYDALGRYGGEEFLVVLPGCNKDAAFHKVEQLRLCLAEKPIATSVGEIDITASFGISLISDGVAKNISSLIKNADDALYRAKKGGRNRVECGE